MARSHETVEGDGEDEFHDAQESSGQRSSGSGDTGEASLREQYLVPHQALCKLQDGRYLAAVAVRVQQATGRAEIGLAPGLRKPSDDGQIEWVSTTLNVEEQTEEAELTQVHLQIFGQTFNCGARTVRVVEPAQSAAPRIRKLVLEKMDPSGKVQGKPFQQDIEAFLKECGKLPGTGAGTPTRGHHQGQPSNTSEVSSEGQPRMVTMSQYVALSRALNIMKVVEGDVGKDAPWHTLRGGNRDSGNSSRLPDYKTARAPLSHGTPEQKDRALREAGGRAEGSIGGMHRGRAGAKRLWNIPTQPPPPVLDASDDASVDAGGESEERRAKGGRQGNRRSRQHRTARKGDRRVRGGGAGLTNRLE